MSNLSATHRVDDIAQARVALVMGSNSDWPVMRQAAEVFEHFGIPYWAQVVSAHRMPHQMVEFGQTATEHGWAGIVAGRSEEHTSELQSRGHLVCRLLLE